MSWEELADSDCDDRFEEFLTPTPLTALDDELTGIADGDQGGIRHARREAARRRLRVGALRR